MADQDVNKLRELRRRRILENSEARLNRIASGCKSKKRGLQENVPMPFSAVETNSQGDNISINEDCSLNSKDKSFELFDNELLRSITSENENLSNLKPRFSPRGDSLDDTPINGTVHLPSFTDTYAFPKKVSDAETRSFGRTRSDARRNSTRAQLVMETLQLSSFSLTSLRPWIIAALAISVKGYFFLTNTFLFIENIFLPFLMLEMIFHTWTKFETQVYAKPTVQYLIPGVLLLCGVPEPVITAFNSAWSTMQCAIQDFTIYLFSFVFSRFFCESYLLQD